MRQLAPTTLALMIFAAAACADPAGIRHLEIDAPHHGRSITGALYYPAAQGGTPEQFGENAVFYGMPVLRDAPMAEGARPLVLLSHGLGGQVRSLAWLSAALAERGAIVVAVNHPNSTWGDFDMEKGLEHWTRVRDLQLALDTLLADPAIRAQIDPDRITAAGFSYGGWTALSMGGLRGNHAASAAHCAQYLTESSHCGDLLRAGVEWNALDPVAWNADYSDPRITAVFAIDPALIWGMTAEHTADMVGDITLVSLGEGENRLLATDFDLAKLPAALPQAEIIRLSSGAHFSMLPLCKEAGAALLAAEQDDPICTDPEGTDRAALHAQVIDAMASQLGL